MKMDIVFSKWDKASVDMRHSHGLHCSFGLSLLYISTMRKGVLKWYKMILLWLPVRDELSVISAFLKSLCVWSAPHLLAAILFQQQGLAYR